MFTDLKMPGMDGVEVVKGVKHLRPDIDVAVITGYATIESAVETMRHGAVDYVQKPFTADELAAFARRLLLKRQARLEAQRLPHVRVVAPGSREAVRGRTSSASPAAPSSPTATPGPGSKPPARSASGSTTSRARPSARSSVCDLPAEGATVRRGEPIFTVHRGNSVVRFGAPLSGRVAEVNTELAAHPDWLGQSPYDGGWVCLLDPADLAGELTALRIGKPVIDWYQAEIARLRQIGGPAEQRRAAGRLG